MMNKKGLSPLVATLLLIAFAIALGVVVMNWGKAYIEEKSEFTTGPKDESVCAFIDLEIIKVSGIEKICYSLDEGFIEVFIENSPDVRVNNLNVRLVGSEGIETFVSVLDKPLEKAAAVQLKLAYPSNIGNIQQIKFIPVIQLEKQSIICSSHELVTENIPICS